MNKKLSNLSRVLFDKATGEFLVGNDIAFDGQAVIFQFVQTTPSSTWVIDLPFDSVFIIPFFFENNEDGTYTEIKAPFNIDSGEQITVSFGAPVRGVANILLTSEVETL